MMFCICITTIYFVCFVCIYYLNFYRTNETNICIIHTEHRKAGKMLFKDFKKYAKSKRFSEKEGELFIDLNDLGMIEWEGGKKLVIDGRSFDSPPGCWHVYPVALDKTHVYIVCPYCGHIHLHGAGGGDYEGHRIAHCNSRSHIKGDITGYYIEQL